MDRIINLNKPSGITSHQAVTRIKRFLGVKKAGHTGTLDPLATGVLLVCLGEATKVTRFFLAMDKKYRARVKLGERTDTGDSQGRVIERKDTISLNEAQLLGAVKLFQGRIGQQPPMYSAVKIRGETLYKLARKGIEVERPERIVEVYEIAVRGVDLPYFDLEVSCSKGFYVRSLCDDIGLRLGTGAHLVALERLRVGPFDIKDAATFEDVERKDFWRDGKSHFSIDAGLSGLKEIILAKAEHEKAKNGVPVALIDASGFHDNEFVRLKDPSENLFGIGRVEKGIIRIERILNL
jgi:tRNA pseudouridine55 synthase